MEWDRLRADDGLLEIIPGQKPASGKLELPADFRWMRVTAMPQKELSSALS
jgi:hypothetical protein